MNDIVQVGNPFGASDLVRPANNIGAVANSDQQRATAEVQAMAILARQAPRNQKASADRILIECQRPGLAEGAIYSFPRGGTAVTGPSIRLARTLARNWGNFDFGMREMEQLPGVTLMQAYAWDLETNTREARAFHVPHEIQLKGGQIKKLTDPRDIYEIAANMGARRTRACILSLIPEDVVEMALNQCEETLRADADCSEKGIKSMLNHFAKFGVVQQQIEARLQRRIDTIQPALMVGLRKIYNSLEDGMSQPDQWFEPIQQGEGEQAKPATGNDAAKAALKRAAPKKAKATEAEGAQQNETDGAGAAAADQAEPNEPAVGAETSSSAEGPAEQQQGDGDAEPAAGDDEIPLVDEGEDDAHEPTMAERAVQIARAGVEHAKTPTYLTGIESDFNKVRAVVEDEVAKEIDALISAKRRELRQKEVDQNGGPQ